jgi:hypothetical protein
VQAVPHVSAMDGPVMETVPVPVLLPLETVRLLVVTGVAGRRTP